MWGQLTNIFQSAASFLSSNKVPPGTPVELQGEIRKENHFKSKKFFLAFSSFVGLLVFYLLSVGILFLLPSKNELISGYVTIFTKTIEIVAIIVASYIGVQAAIDLKASVLMPVHWSKFTLALHPWNEPIKKVTAKAKEMKMPLTTPLIGEVITINKNYPDSIWWEF